MQPALAPSPLSLARARHWGYHAACHEMPEEWHQRAVAYAQPISSLYADPIFRERVFLCAYCIFWVHYLRVLRARHMTWALELNNNHLGRALRHLRQSPATERAYGRARARLTRLAKQSMDAVLQRLKQLKIEGIGLQLVDSSFDRPTVATPAPQPQTEVPAAGTAPDRTLPLIHLSATPFRHPWAFTAVLAPLAPARPTAFPVTPRPISGHSPPPLNSLHRHKPFRINQTASPAQVGTGDATL